MVGPISFTIIVLFLGSTNLYKNDDEATKIYSKNCVLYVLCKLILHQCPRIVFPSCSSIVEHVFLAMVTKTMELHVLPHL
jgi:hypothetical protein